MSPSAELPLAVFLVDVGEDVLEHLLAVAVRDADADEVTPPLGSTPGWNSGRISWFREYHRTATGLDDPARQKSWAIRYAGGLAGSIRLKRTGPGTLDTGIWLARRCRGLGIGQEALRQVRAHAVASGAATLEACTTAGNRAALALLRGSGADLVYETVSETPQASVRAYIPLR
jgi:[ribosomal protein S5]-alanine N-acetyltransferase